MTRQLTKRALTHFRIIKKDHKDCCNFFFFLLGFFLKNLSVNRFGSLFDVHQIGRETKICDLAGEGSTFPDPAMATKASRRPVRGRNETNRRGFECQRRFTQN